MVSTAEPAALAVVMEHIATEHEALVARLQAFGTQPVADVAARQHLAAMQRAQLEPEVQHQPFGEFIQVRFRRVRTVAAAMVVGLLGASGLAAAGALPPAAQNFAADALGVVGLDVPRADPDCANAQDAPGSADDRCEDASVEGD